MCAPPPLGWGTGLWLYKPESPTRAPTRGYGEAAAATRPPPSPSRSRRGYRGRSNPDKLLAPWERHSSLCVFGYRGRLNPVAPPGPMELDCGSLQPGQKLGGTSLGLGLVRKMLTVGQGGPDSPPLRRLHSGLGDARTRSRPCLDLRWGTPQSDITLRFWSPNPGRGSKIWRVKNPSPIHQPHSHRHRHIALRPGVVPTRRTTVKRPMRAPLRSVALAIRLDS